MTVRIISNEGEYTFINPMKHTSVTIESRSLSEAKKEYRINFDLVGEKINWKLI